MPSLQWGLQIPKPTLAASARVGRQGEAATSTWKSERTVRELYIFSPLTCLIIDEQGEFYTEPFVLNLISESACL